jgi:hypothetical protein
MGKWIVKVNSDEKSITDGSIELFCYDELVEIEELKQICDKLNKDEDEATY